MITSDDGTAQGTLLSIVVQGGTEPVVTVSGELDIATAGGLRECLLRVICRYGPRLALDLEGVTFMDCAGISALVATRRRARLEGGWVHITRASPCAGRLLMLLRMGRLFAAKEQSVAATLFETRRASRMCVASLGRLPMLRASVIRGQVRREARR